MTKVYDLRLLNIWETTQLMSRILGADHVPEKAVALVMVSCCIISSQSASCKIVSYKNGFFHYPITCDLLRRINVAGIHYSHRN